MKLVLNDPGSLVSQEKILNFGLALKLHKDKLTIVEKEFRKKLNEFMDENGLQKIENDEVSIVKTKGTTEYKHDVETVMEVLGENAVEYLKADNGKINKELVKIGVKKFSPDQANKLEASSVSITGPSQVRITKKKIILT